MMFYHLASLSALGISDSEVLFLWVRVIAFIGLLGASAYFLSLYAKKKKLNTNLSSTGKIVIADTCSLGNRQFLMIAQYDNEKHLLGVSQGSINHLAKLGNLTAVDSSSSHTDEKAL